MTQHDAFVALEPVLVVISLVGGALGWLEKSTGSLPGSMKMIVGSTAMLFGLASPGLQIIPAMGFVLFFWGVLEPSEP